MLSKPKYGWVKVSIGDFECEASYLTDVALDLLNCIQQWITAGAGACYLNCEGRGEYVVVFSPTGKYVIHDDRMIEIKIDSLSKYPLANELIADIENNMEEWKWWDADCDDQQEADDYEQRLRMGIAALRAYVPLEYQTNKTHIL